MGLHALMNTQTIVIVSAVTIAIVLIVLVAILMRAFGISDSHIARGIVASTAVALLCLSPIAVDALVVWFNQSRGAGFVMIDPGWPAKIMPAVVAIIVAIALR